jgi:hypothetical protein
VQKDLRRYRVVRVDMAPCAALQKSNGVPCPCKASCKNIDGTLEVCVRHFDFVEVHKEKILENIAKKAAKEQNLKDNEKLLEENKGKIPLRNQQGAIIDFALVSEEDYERVMKHKWSKMTYPTNAYAIACIDGVHVRMHHFIIGRPADGHQVDHYPDKNGLNNRRDNLRFATYSQNQQNKARVEGGTSKYKGVCFNKNMWKAASSDKCLGYFDTEEEAAKRYDTYVLLWYGQGASTNGLVTFEEIKDIDIDTIVSTREKDLPLYISKYGNLQYKVRRIYKDYSASFVVSSIEEAKEKVKHIEEEIQKIFEKEKEEHFKKPIVRNEKGQAIVLIPNKNGEIIDETVVSDECWHDVTQYFWSKTREGDYYASHIDGKKVVMHRYIMKAKPGEIIDHQNENGNTTKINTLENLRVNTASGNSHNTKKRTGTSSKYFGVSFIKKELKFQSQIRKDKIKYSLGYYDKDVKAAIAYNIMAKHLYGDFSRQNKIKQSDIDLYYNEVYEKIKHKLSST